MTLAIAEVPLRVLFVGFQDQDNLGLRYLMSAARAAGHEVGIQTFTTDPQPLVARALRARPAVIGFSLIFQYMAPQFDAVISALRAAGVTAHVVVGGHFASFEPQAVLRLLPGADSIVRFEGEATLLDLLDRLGRGQEWRDIAGLAARLDDGSLRVNCLRPQIKDLDTLPWPMRDDIAYEQSDLPTAAILGSRGCPWNCDFCSIRPFYEAQEGSLRRLRRAGDVVEEMRHLFHDRGVSLFLFQDDDFLATGARARAWAGDVADRIADSDIGGRVAWKMSCRSDELRPDILARMKRGGLTHVYMGVESGDEQGLKAMNKLMKPIRHIEAGQMLRAQGLSFDFGFMLLDPWSDFRMVLSNVAFLETFVGDGWAVAGFCRMLPYAGTPTARKLQAEGRLEGTDTQPDYRFLDPRMDMFYAWFLETFHKRNFTNGGLVHILRALIFESRLQAQDRRWMTAEETRWLQHVAALSNRTALFVLRQAVDHIAARTSRDILVHSGHLSRLTHLLQAEEARLTARVETFWADPGRQDRRRRARSDAGQQAKEATFAPSGALAGKLAGAFENSWTAAPAARETQGIGVG